VTEALDAAATLADLLTLEKEYEAARDVRKTILDEYPYHPESIYRLALAENALGNQTEAIRLLQRTLQFAPGHLGAATALAGLRASTDQYGRLPLWAQRAAPVALGAAVILIAVVAFFVIRNDDDTVETTTTCSQPTASPAPSPQPTGKQPTTTPTPFGFRPEGESQARAYNSGTFVLRGEQESADTDVKREEATHTCVAGELRTVQEKRTATPGRRDLPETYLWIALGLGVASLLIIAFPFIRKIGAGTVSIEFGPPGTSPPPPATPTPG